MLCLSVKRNNFASSDAAMPVAAAATEMLCRLIILPITPPLELDAAMSTGDNPSVLAVTTCRLPNNALAEESLPGRNTPGQPSQPLTHRNIPPLADKPRH